MTSTGVHWTFVGAGNMSASLVGGLLAAGEQTSAITTVDPNAAARETIGERFSVATTATFDAAANRSDSDHSTEAHCIVIAVKPNIVEQACRSVSELIPSSSPPLIVSVAAGVRAEALGTWLGDAIPIVRCMPNTPALLGLGASGLFANKRCSKTHRAIAERLLSAAGTVHWVEEETLLDAVTATSGSGPAYFFYLIEQMSHAGQALGLDADTARELAIDTAFGAASMARAREYPPDELRRRVTSKGGTTAAALAVFDDAGLPSIVHAAMRAAHDRAVSLGDQFSPNEVLPAEERPSDARPTQED